MLQVYSLGRPIAIQLGVFEHFGVISCHPYSGEPTLISLSAKRGGITEEPWHEAVGKRAWRYATELEGTLPPHQILARARSKISAHGYNLVARNCEHFVRWSAGLKVESKQVGSVCVIGLLFGLALILNK